MDLATIVGATAGFGLLIMGMALGGASFSSFVDYPSVAIVIGGSLAALLVSYPLAHVLGMGKIVKNCFVHESRNVTSLIEDLVRYAEIARRDGILALENMTRDISDPFIVKGVQMAVDGTDPELIEQVLRGELDSLSERHGRGKSMVEALGKYAPAFGMIGTLIGLVVMLKSMGSDGGMDKIGQGMAVALITTLYGAILANLLFLPLAEKLTYYTNEELLLKEIVVRGVMSIQSGDNPRVVEQKLSTFLPPNMRRGEGDEQRQAA